MVNRLRKIDCLALCLVLAPAAFSQAAGHEALQNLESIRTAAARFVIERLSPPGSAVAHAEASVLDSRLRLTPCTHDVRAFSPTGELRANTRLTIGVRCDTPAWTVYVPVNVETELEVLITTRALPRNAAIQSQDVELLRRRVPGFATGYLSSRDQLAGQHLRNAVPPGTALGVDLLSPDVLIRRGQRVTLVASAGSLEVRAQGEAVADALPNGRIRVLNLASGRIVEGQVESRDCVRVSL